MPEIVDRCSASGMRLRRDLHGPPSVGSAVIERPECRTPEHIAGRIFPQMLPARPRPPQGRGGEESSRLESGNETPHLSGFRLTFSPQRGWAAEASNFAGAARYGHPASQIVT